MSVFKPKIIFCVFIITSCGLDYKAPKKVLAPMVEVLKTKNHESGSGHSFVFSQKMDKKSLWANTKDTKCVGSIQLSSNNFSTCLKIKEIELSEDKKEVKIHLNPTEKFSCEIKSSKSHFVSNFKGVKEQRIMNFEGVESYYDLKVTKEAKSEKNIPMIKDYLQEKAFKIINLKALKEKEKIKKEIEEIEKSKKEAKKTRRRSKESKRGSSASK